MFNISKVIIWGHKLHSHTHSYIHYGFFKAFQHLNYNVLWLDNDDILNDLNFDNSLFITEGQVDEKIPINESSYYVLHNCNGEKYKSISVKNIVVLQVYTNTKPKNALLIENQKMCFYANNGLFIPWGTDLLPHEIDEYILNYDKYILCDKKNCVLIGMPLYPWDDVVDYCKTHDIEYYQRGGFSKNNIDSLENVKYIQTSYISPAIQCLWQVENDYIPCRIFKNISYGKMGITNNKSVNELFDNKLIYDTNIHDLMHQSEIFEKQNYDDKKKIIIPLMHEVKNYHTYLNRIECIFFVLEKLK